MASRLAIRTLLFLVSIFYACLLTGTTALGQTVGHAAEKKLRQVMANVSPELAAQRQALGNRHYPYVIFIPGILGSKIYKHKNGKRQLVWGDTIIDDNDLFYDENEKVDVEIFDSLSTIRKDVYGQALEYLDNQAFGLEALSIFRYDWRADNRKTAELFNSWICKKRASLAGRPILILAHSMGGLMLKYWFAKYPAGVRCAKTAGAAGTDQPLNITEVIFMGTPHLGSPKTIRIFADGFKLLLNDNDITGNWFGTIVKNALGYIDKWGLAANLNKYGASFPSAYQLLPLYHSSDARVAPCTAGLPTQDLPPPVRLKLNDYTEKTTFFRFSAKAWEKIGWPATGIPPKLAKTYYTAFLPKALNGAVDFLCTVAQVKLPPNIQVRYVVSAKHDTEASFLFDVSKHKPGTPAPLIQSKTEHRNGDGTVPSSIARGTNPLTRYGFNVIWSDFDHAKLVKDDDLYQSVSALFDAAQWRITHEQASLSPENAKKLAAIHQRAGVFIPVGKDWMNLQPGWIAETNTKIAENLGLDANKIVSLASLADNAGERLSLYGVAANLNNTNPWVKLGLSTKIAEAWQNAGQIQFAYEALTYKNDLVYQKLPNTWDNRMIMNDPDLWKNKLYRQGG